MATYSCPRCRREHSRAAIDIEQEIVAYTIAPDPRLKPGWIRCSGCGCPIDGLAVLGNPSLAQVRASVEHHKKWKWFGCVVWLVIIAVAMVVGILKKAGILE
jgi:hypothetical protein